MKAMIDDALQFHQTALNLRAYRQQLLSSNIANAHTPNYKAQDIDVGAALGGALAGRIGPLALAATTGRHIETPTASQFETLARFRSEAQASVDGNTVDMDVERSAFAENAIHYEASVTFINGLIKTMQLAIQGQ
jgi:flagellar basal-body rod protein FlgB